MFKGYYAAASGMLAQQRRQEMLTNNIANANTPGFKADRGTFRAFPEMLISRMSTTELPNNRRFGNYKVLGELNTGTYMQEAIPDFSMGPIKETGNQTDLALIIRNVPVNPDTNTPGSLFFTVQNANGEPRYTRNGSFALDQNGFLTTTAGHYVLDTDGNQIQVLGNEFQVQPDGTVSENGEPIAQINVAFAENANEVVREGNGLYRFTGEGQLPTANGNNGAVFEIKQGFLERSNVDIQQAMTDMMVAYRNFEANQQILKAYDQSMDKTVNQIGRLG